MNENFLSGKTVVISGGLSGQGLAIAHAMAASGANVAAGSYVRNTTEMVSDAAYYPDANEIEKTRELLSHYGTCIYVDHLDVRSQDSVDAFLNKTVSHCGNVNVLVNSAGTTVEQGVVGHDDTLWNKIIDTNLTGAFRMIRTCLAEMIKNRWGRIINIGSTAASVGWKDNPAYCASKAGLLGLTRCVALEGASFGVNCNMISPTWVNTELMRRNVHQVAERDNRNINAESLTKEIAASNPQGRIIEPNEVAQLAVYLCRDESRGINGDNIQITGGALW